MSFATSAVKRLGAVLIDASKDSMRGQNDVATARYALKEASESALAQNLVAQAAWAQVVQIAGMAGPASTADVSIPLSMSSLARRYRPIGSSGGESDVEESDLLLDESNFVLLGDPGAGKTTTLKRATLDLSSQLAEGVEGARTPIVCVCRDHDWSTYTLLDIVAQQLGLAQLVGARENESIARAQLRGIPAALDALDAVLLVDGIDEIPTRSDRDDAVRSIELTARSLNHSKIIVSSRSGDSLFIEGFSTAEIIPLAPDQIEQIVRNRLGAGSGFLERVSRTTLSDLTDRPLFLEQMLVVFESLGDIPDQPSALTRQLVRLLVQGWDEQRRIHRGSGYADFDNETKRQFLAALAFELTLSQRITFSEGDLLDAFLTVHRAFGLPSEQAKRVVQEIESHVGVVVARSDGYEFSHLTMQEYLCAEHMVRMPVDDVTGSYLRSYPAPVAIAVALSSRPSDWLAQVVAHAEIVGHPDAFLERLSVERPRFTDSPELGRALLRLAGKSENAQVWQRLRSVDGIVESIRTGMAAFRFTDDGVSNVKLLPRRPDDFFAPPTKAIGSIPREVWDALHGVEAEHTS